MPPAELTTTGALRNGYVEIGLSSGLNERLRREQRKRYSEIRNSSEFCSRSDPGHEPHHDQLRSSSEHKL